MKTAIITLAVGPTGQEMHELTAPSQQAYAAKIGATYAVLSDATMPYPMGEKWRLSKLALPFDRVVYMDADIVVRPDACSVFDLVPEGRVGLYDDLPDMEGSEWFHSEVEQLQREQELPARRLSHCYNTGLVVFDREHADIFAPPTKPFTPFFCAEQHFINMRLATKGYEVFSLGRETHWQWWSDKAGRHKDAAAFLHFSGLRDHQLRLSELKAATESRQPVGNEPSETFKKCNCAKTKEIRDRLKELKSTT